MKNQEVSTTQELTETTFSDERAEVHLDKQSRGSAARTLGIDALMLQGWNGDWVPCSIWMKENAIAGDTAFSGALLHCWVKSK